MIKTFEEAVKYLEKHIPTPKQKHPGKLGLDRMKYLMKLLGDPQLKYPTIHVGGTSGKGSTATFIASILGTKYRTGLHTSPHLVKVNERIKIIGKCEALSVKGLGERVDISDKDLIKVLNLIIPIIKKIETTRFGPPSYFEISTAMAFLFFYLQKVDIAVIEVGMGGRFDATNIIKPEVAVITNVGLDHTEILGSTVEKIAYDKAGIIKEGISVVSGVKQASVIGIMREECERKKAGLSLLNNTQLIPPPGRSLPRLRSGQAGHLPGVFNAFRYKIKKIDSHGSIFDYYGENHFRNLKIKLLGEHQVENAAIAIRTIEVSGFRSQVSENNIRKGLIETFIPGRIEIVSKQPLVILDGAHNPEKMKALTGAIKSILPNKRTTVVLAIKKEKNAREMLELLSKIADRFIITEFKLKGDLGNIVSYDCTDLERIFTDLNGKIEIKIIKDPVEALSTAISESEEDSLILVTGSLYLIGEILRNSKFPPAVAFGNSRWRVGKSTTQN